MDGRDLMDESESMDERENEKMAFTALQWIVATLAENNKEAQEEADAKGPEDNFVQGRAEAYFEVMDIIESRLEILDVHLEEEDTNEADDK